MSDKVFSFRGVDDFTGKEIRTLMLMDEDTFSLKHLNALFNPNRVKEMIDKKIIVSIDNNRYVVADFPLYRVQLTLLTLQALLGAWDEEFVEKKKENDQE